MLLATRTKNLIKKTDPTTTYTFLLKNILVNGQKRGCSGFVKNGNRCVYIDTEESCAGWLPPYMYRYADNEKDYRGYRNNFAKTETEFAEEIVRLLGKDMTNETRI